MKRFPRCLAPALALFSGIGWTQTRASQEWLTWGGDPARSGWAKSETTLTPANVGRLELKWKTQLDNPSKVEVLSPLTAPVVAENVRTRQGNKTLVFVVGSEDIVYGLDAESGKVVWQRRFPNDRKPITPPTVNCPDTQNATPVIDKEAGILYALTSDGKLRGLSLADGEDRMPPTDFVKPRSRNWSLNLIDGIVYTNVARGCEGAVASLTGMKVKDPARPLVKFDTSRGRPAGAWGRSGPVLGPKGILLQTADGVWDATRNLWANSVLQIGLNDMQVTDYFTPENAAFLTEKDLDFGSASPIAFRFQQWNLVAAGGKEGTLYLMDADSLGGAEHRTPVFSQKYGNDDNDSGQLYAARGMWGASATAEDAQGNRWLYVPLWGPISRKAPVFKSIHGMADTGSILGFQLGVDKGKPTLLPMWMSRSMAVPDPPVIVNGMVFSLSTGENTKQHPWSAEDRTSNVTNAILYAFDATTGKELYSSNQLIDGWSHFGGLAVAGGRIYAVTYQNRVYSFGLKR
jgi:outer membrane protein assembly factor BamB